MAETNSNANMMLYVEAAVRRKWLVIIPLIACTLIAVLYAYSLPSYYKSTTLILVEQQQIPSNYVMPTDQTPFGQRLSTIRQQIMSRTKLEQIIAKYNLYSDQGLYGRTLARLGVGQASKPSKEEAIETMTRDIEVKVIGEKGAFSISYVGKDPYVVMQVTSTLASLFIEENLRAREQYAEGTSDFLSGELENAKKELAAQEEALKRYKERNMGTLPQQLDANLRTLDRLQMELQTVNMEIKNSEDKKSFIEMQAGSEALPQAAATALENELERLQNELSVLLSTYKETYPDVVITKKRIEEIRQILSRQDKKGDQPGADPVRTRVAFEMATVDSNIQNLKKRQAEIRQQIKAYEKRVEETPGNEQRLVDLRRDYDISLKNYQALLEKKLNARLAENLEKRQKGERFTVIDPANLPEKPFKPKRPMVILFGAAIGLGLGAGLVFLAEFANPAFIKPEELEGAFSYPVLASVPVFTELKPKLKIARSGDEAIRKFGIW